MVEFRGSRFGPEVQQGGLQVWLHEITEYNVPGLSGPAIAADVVWFEPEGKFSERLWSGLQDLKGFIRRVNCGEFGVWTPKYMTGYVDKSGAKLASRIGMSAGQEDLYLYPVCAEISQIERRVQDVENSGILRKFEERVKSSRITGI